MFYIISFFALFHVCTNFYTLLPNSHNLFIDFSILFQVTMSFAFLALVSK